MVTFLIWSTKLWMTAFSVSLTRFSISINSVSIFFLGFQNVYQKMSGAILMTSFTFSVTSFHWQLKTIWFISYETSKTLLVEGVFKSRIHYFCLKKIYKNSIFKATYDTSISLYFTSYSEVSFSKSVFASALACLSFFILS